MSETDYIDETEPDFLTTFSVTGEEEHLRGVISDLKFLASVKGGERIDVKSKMTIKTDISSRAYRTVVNRETRDDTYQFVERVFKITTEKIYHYKTMESPFYRNCAKLLIANIEKSFVGIQSLMDTYKGDEGFVSKLDALIETTKAKIDRKK